MHPLHLPSPAVCRSSAPKRVGQRPSAPASLRQPQWDSGPPSLISPPLTHALCQKWPWPQALWKFSPNSLPFPGSTHTPRETGRVWPLVHPHQVKEKKQKCSRPEEAWKCREELGCAEREGRREGGLHCLFLFHIHIPFQLLPPLPRMPDGHRRGPCGPRRREEHLTPQLRA